MDLSNCRRRRLRPVGDDACLNVRRAGCRCSGGMRPNGRGFGLRNVSVHWRLCISQRRQFRDRWRPCGSRCVRFCRRIGRGKGSRWRVRFRRGVRRCKGLCRGACVSRRIGCCRRCGRRACNGWRIGLGGRVRRRKGQRGCIRIRWAWRCRIGGGWCRSLRRHFGRRIGSSCSFCHGCGTGIGRNLMNKRRFAR